MSTVTIRERTPIPMLGELLVSVIAPRGFSMCPPVSAVVSAIRSSFLHAVKSKPALYVENNSLNCELVLQAIDWFDEVHRTSHTKAMTLACSTDSERTITAKFHHPVLRNSSGDKERDHTVEFSIQFVPSAG